MNIEVRWRRTWQPKQYESEGLDLVLGGDFAIPGEGNPAVAAAVAKEATKIQRQLLYALTEMGDQLMAERLGVADPRQNEATPVAATRRRG